MSPTPLILVRDGAARRPPELKSNEESARWRRQRLLSERFGEEIHLRQKLEIRRRNQNRIFFRGRKFQLLRLQRELVFLFRFLGRGDGLANRTGIFAVKRAGHGFGKRVRAQVVRQHRRPRDRLQHGPMRAGARDERNHHKNFAKPDEHRKQH